MSILDRFNYKNFCYCCTLQSGVIMSVVVFSTIFIGMIVMTAYSVTILNGWTSENICGLCLSYGHALLIIFGICLSFYGAYKEEAKLITYSSFCMTVATLLYIAASIVSYIPDVYYYSCVVHRCPDHIWMQDSFWRSYYFENKTHVFISDEEPPENHEDSRGEEEEYMENVSDDPYYYGSLQISEHKSDSGTGKHKGNNRRIRSSLRGSRDTTSFGNLSHLDGSYQAELEAGRTNLSAGEDVTSLPSYTYELGSFLDDETTHLVIRYPALGLTLSILFNLGYIVFLLYIIVVYISYSNELKLGIPGGFTKESWVHL